MDVDDAVVAVFPDHPEADAAVKTILAAASPTSLDVHGGMLAAGSAEQLAHAHG